MLGLMGSFTNWLCLLALFTAQTKCDTCWSYAGVEWPDQVKCNGSDTCCASAHECMPNRLCKKDGSADYIFVRGPCATNPYNPSVCAQVCLFDEIKENTGSDDNHFPRAEACGGGAYCCRQDTIPCCDKENISKTYLDDNGVRLAGPPTETSSTTTASSHSTVVSSLTSAGPATETISTTTTSPSGTMVSIPTSANPTPTQVVDSSSLDSESGSGDTVALKVGLGVAIPLVAIIATLITWYFLRKSKGKKNPSADQSAAMQKNTFLSIPSQAYEVHEMMGRPVEGDRARAPRELMGSEVY